MAATLELEEPTLRMTGADRIGCEPGRKNSDILNPGFRLIRAGTLYRYLDMEQLMDAFTKRLGKVVPFDALQFKNVPLGQSIDKKYSPVDVSFEHLLEYSVADNKSYLGDLTIFRRNQFLSSEVRSVNGAVDALVGPLRNATMYLQACQSAYLDKLTGVQNRAALDATLSRAALSGSKSATTAVMVCDVDRFKSINDNCGHKSGDAVLQQFAELLRAKTRKSDTVYRYGGDEFVIILNDNTFASARESAERIRKSVEQTTLHIDNACVHLTTTIGLTGLKPGESFDEAFLRADAALLLGKKNGKNKVVCR